MRILSPYEDDGLIPLLVDATAQSTTPPGTPPRSLHASGSFSTPSGSLSVTKSLDSLSSPSKRRYVPDPVDIDVVKKIKANEIELRDRNTVLRGIKQNVSLHILRRTRFAECSNSEFLWCEDRICGQTQETEGVGKIWSYFRWALYTRSGLSSSPR